MVHQLPFAANCSVLFGELPVNDRPAAARTAGFDAVEFWWPFRTAVPTDTEADAFVSAVRDAGVRLVQLNFFAGDMGSGDRGLVSWPGRSGEFQDSVEAALDIGRVLGCNAFNALYGNRQEGVRSEEQDEIGLQNLAAAAVAAGTLDAIVLVESVSGAPRYPLRRAADAIAVIERVERQAGVHNLRFLCDLYHLAVNGDDIPAVIDGQLPRIGHVQIADAPGRGEPGTGDLDLDAHLSRLEAGGYPGWVGLEYLPSTTTEQSLEWLPRERRASSPSRTRKGES